MENTSNYNFIEPNDPNRLETKQKEASKESQVPLEEKITKFSYYDAYSSLLNMNKKETKAFIKYLGMPTLINIENFAKKGFATMTSAPQEKMAKIDFEAKLKLAEVDHSFFKVIACWGRKKFSNDLLEPSRNIASKNVLRKDDPAAANLVVSELLEKHENQMTSACLDKLKNQKYGPTNIEGEGNCLAQTWDFISKLGDGEISEENLRQLVRKEYSKGQSEKVPAVQALFHIYEENFDFTNPKNEDKIYEAIEYFIDQFESSEIPFSLDYTKLDLKEFDLNETDIPELYQTIKNLFQAESEKDEGYWYSHEVTRIKKEPITDIEKKEKLVKLDLADRFVKCFLYDSPAFSPKVNKEIRIMKKKAIRAQQRSAFKQLFHLVKDDKFDFNSFVGDCVNFQSSREHLKNFSNLPDGKYSLSFSLRDSLHAISYIKQNGQGYIMDPNYGLIKCHTPDAHSILKLLSLYPPPNSSQDEPNYKVEMTRYL